MWRRGTKPACEICKDPCSFTCQGCKTTHYCSAEHQAIDWAQHKTTCQLYAKICIKQRNLLAQPNRRRILTAQCNFKKGSLIYVESPILESPDNLLKTPKEMLEFGVTTSCIVCRNILSPHVDGVGKTMPNTCNNCSWPLCGLENCKSFHSDMECITLAKNKSVGPEQFSSTMPPHQFIFYLRILKLDDKNSDNYYKIMEMDIHPEIDEYEVTTAEIVTPTKTTLPLIVLEQSARYKEFLRISELFNSFRFHTSEEEKIEIIRMIQVSDWNSRSFNIPSQNKSTPCRSYHGIFYVTPSALQSCTPNALSVPTHDFKLHCFATQDIEAGDAITISQDPIATYLDNLGRRRRFRERLSTKCTCTRCLDPIENYNGAFRCSAFEDPEGCKDGNLLPFVTEKKSKSLKQFVDVWNWKCDKCLVMRPMNIVGSLRTKILKKFEVFVKNRNDTWTSKLASLKHDDDVPHDATGSININSLIEVDPFVLFMKEQEACLHPNHFILIMLKVKLLDYYSEAVHKIFMLGKQRELEAHILDAGLKLYEMSRSVLEIVNVCQPGFSDMACNLSYYIQQGFILIAPNFLRTMIKPEEDKAEFRKRLAKMTKIRREIRIFCKRTLNWNPGTIIEKLEWLDMDGQLYKLLRRQYPFLYEK